MEEIYEVLKFIEHGAQCRQSMDCEKGDLLVYYLRENRRLERRLFLNGSVRSESAQISFTGAEEAGDTGI